MYDCYNGPSGETSQTFSAPAGFRFEVVPAGDGTNLIQLVSPGGSRQTVYSYAYTMICVIGGLGMWAGVTTYTGNPQLGAVAGAMVALSCLAGKPANISEDGDSYANCY